MLGLPRPRNAEAVQARERRGLLMAVVGRAEVRESFPGDCSRSLSPLGVAVGAGETACVLWGRSVCSYRAAGVSRCVCSSAGALMLGVPSVVRGFGQRSPPVCLSCRCCFCRRTTYSFSGDDPRPCTAEKGEACEWEGLAPGDSLPWDLATILPAGLKGQHSPAPCKTWAR